jgi:hypothetical protein
VKGISVRYARAFRLRRCASRSLVKGISVRYARAFRLRRCASRRPTRTAPICCYLQWVTTRACYLQEQNRELADFESGITSMPTRIDANTQSTRFRQGKGWGRRQPRTTAGHSEDHGRRTPCRAERRPREKNQLDFDKRRRLPDPIIGRGGGGDNHERMTGNRERDRPLMVEEWSVGGAPSSSAASSCSGRQQIQGQGMEHGCSAVDPWLPRCSGVRARKRGGGRLAELRRRVCGEAETLRQGSERQRKTPDRWVPPVRTDENCGQKRSLL